MLGNMNLSKRLIMLFMLVGLVPLAVVGYLAYNRSSVALQQQAMNQLIALREVKKGQIQSYFSERMGDLRVLSQNPLVTESIAKFEEAYMAGGLQGAQYRQVENEYGPGLAYYMREYGYYDIFLIAEDGDIVYTGAKERDLGTNLVSGIYSSSNLASAYRRGLQAPVLEDFKVYAASNEPASFVAAPVRDKDGKLIGVLAFQLALNQINDIMQENAGLGESGETYLVGEDKLMRSDSRFQANTVLSLAVDTEASRAALAGGTDARIIDDYRGTPVLSAYAPLDIEGTKWAILAEIDKSEAFAPATALLTWILAIAAVICAIVAVVAIVTARSISNPIREVVKIAGAIAKGDLSSEDLKIKSKDEIGQLGTALNTMSGALKGVIGELQGVLGSVAAGDLTKDITGDYQGAYDEIKKATTATIDRLNNLVSQVASATSQIASSTQQLSATSEEMAAGAEEQTSQTSQVATSVEEMSATVQEVAKNAKNASTSSEEAGKTAEEGGEIVSQTVGEMEKIAKSVSELQVVIQGLNKNSEKIGDIVGVIDDVADQTNLLALNAAIEAARAGEQGRGFAVVADEVRKLAERTTSSTKEIADMVKSIQGDTSQAVSSMEEAGKEVKEGVGVAGKAGDALKKIVDMSQGVSQIVQQIATAAEQQAAASEEISSNVESIASVSKQSASGAQQTSSAAQELSSLTDNLQSLVDQFKLKDNGSKAEVKVEKAAVKQVKVAKVAPVEEVKAKTKKPKKKKTA